MLSKHSQILTSDHTMINLEMKSQCHANSAVNSEVGLEGMVAVCTPKKCLLTTSSTCSLGVHLVVRLQTIVIERGAELYAFHADCKIRHYKESVCFHDIHDVLLL